MARAFASASSQSLTVAAAPVTAYPITLACWFNPVAANATYGLMSIDDGTNTNSFVVRTGSGGTAGAVLFQCNNGGSAATSTAFGAGAWAHACGVGVSATSRSAFLNGGGKGTVTTSLTPVGITTTWLGQQGGSAPRFLNGSLAECAIWNIALTDAEVALLGSTTTPMSPLLMHPESLVFYAPLLSPVVSPEIELMKANNLTPSASPPTLAAHTRIFYPKQRWTGKFTAPVVAADTLFAQAIM